MDTKTPTAKDAIKELESLLEIYVASSVKGFTVRQHQARRYTIAGIQASLKKLRDTFLK